MASKPKYTQEICKLSQSSTRLKEQVAGRLLQYWTEDLKGGKWKICAVLLDGHTFQNVLTIEAWSEADQFHAVQHLQPCLGEVVGLQNIKIVTKGQTKVFHGNQLKLAYDKLTIVTKLDDNEKYAKELPQLAIAECSNLASVCAISLVVCVQTVAGPLNRDVEGGVKAVSNLQVAFDDRKIDCAFWGDKLENTMGHSKAGDVYHLN